MRCVTERARERRVSTLVPDSSHLVHRNLYRSFDRDETSEVDFFFLLGEIIHNDVEATARICKIASELNSLLFKCFAPEQL